MFKKIITPIFLIAVMSISLFMNNCTEEDTGVQIQAEMPNQGNANSATFICWLDSNTDYTIVLQTLISTTISQSTTTKYETVTGLSSGTYYIHCLRDNDNSGTSAVTVGDDLGTSAQFTISDGAVTSVPVTMTTQ